MYYFFKCFLRFAPIGYKREWNWITNLTKTLIWNKVWSLEQLTSKMHSIDSIDSINRYFLYGTLHRFWFEPFFVKSIVKWIETSVYWDITRCRGDFLYQVLGRRWWFPGQPRNKLKRVTTDFSSGEVMETIRHNLRNVLFSFWKLSEPNIYVCNNNMWARWNTGSLG